MEISRQFYHLFFLKVIEPNYPAERCKKAMVNESYNFAYKIISISTEVVVFNNWVSFII